MTALTRIPQAVKAAAIAAKAVFSIGGSAYDALAFGWHAALTRWNPTYGYQRLVKLATENPHASRGLRLISQLMASVPLYVERRGPEGWETPKVNPHEWALDLFDRPGGRLSRQALYDLVTVALYAGGEFWVDKGGAPMTGPNAGRPNSIRIILPDQFEDFIVEGGEVVGYRFRTRAVGSYGGGEYFTRTVEDCHHIRLPNPADPERGLAIMVAGQAMAMMRAATNWNESIAQGGGRVPGYWAPTGLKPGEMLDPEAVKRAEDHFDRRGMERAKANAEMVLSGKFERVKGDVTPKDADWTNGLKLAIRQIATMLGVPATLLGDEKAGSLTDSGVDSEVRALYLLTVLPLLERVLEEVSAWLLPDGYRVWYDRDQIEALQEDMNAVWTRYREAYAAKLISRDEARVAIGYDELGGEHAEISTANPFEGVFDGDPGGDGAVRSLPAFKQFDRLDVDLDDIVARYVA